MGNYYEEGYIEEDYYDEEQMAVTPLPAAPSRSDTPAVFVQKADAFLAGLVKLALEVDAVALAMNNNSTNSVSSSSNEIADTGSKTFTVETGKSYLVGQTVRAASVADGTVWMQGDVTSYNSTTGVLVISMNAKQGSGTITSWTISLSMPGTSGGSLTQDFDVKSLRHAIGDAIPSATTIDLSAVTGNMNHVTGATTIAGATMTAGKDVWVIYDGALQLTYHETNHRLNSGGANITTVAGDMALYTYDGVTVRVAFFKMSGKANVETAPPASAPVGSCLIHFGSSPPTNYLTCPTTATNISRTTYSALFAAIGITWGAGDGSTTFGMPWFAPNYAIIQSNGNVGIATTGEVKAHTHTITTWETETGAAGVTPGGPTAAGSFETSSTGAAANYAAGSRVLICVKYQ